MKYPLIALPLSTLLILTGCGGSGSGGDDKQATPPPAPSPVPTVTVTAPESAIANVAFDVSWTSTDASSCSSAFTSAKSTSGKASVKASESGEQTYEVTCTGDGGSAKGSAKINIIPAATAEGFWQGTATAGADKRNVSGVVTKENGYWLVYSGLIGGGDEDKGVGFFAGTGSFTNNSTGLGGDLSSTNLREFNFQGVEAAGGNFNATFDKSATDKAQFSLSGSTVATALSATHTFDGAIQGYTIDGFDPTTAIITLTPPTITFDDNGSPTGIVQIDGTGVPMGIDGVLRFTDPVTKIGVEIVSLATVELTYNNRALKISGPRNTTWDPVTRKLKVTNVQFAEQGTTPACDDGGTGACDFVPVSDSHGDVEITFSGNQGDPLSAYTGVAHMFQIVEQLVDPSAVPGCPNDTSLNPAGENSCANATLTFNGTAVPSITQQIAGKYDDAYELTPALSDLLGTYTGSDGVDQTLNTGSTFDVALDGTVNASAEAGACTVTGSLVPHTVGGNVYDATLHFANGSGTCSYSGDFTGVATYDGSDSVQSITVTAVEVATPPALPTKGFLFIGSKAQPQ